MTLTLPEQVIINLEAHSGRLDKEQILKQQAIENNVEFFDGVRMTLDDLITFGVKKVPSHSGPDGKGLSWSSFKELANLLYTRQLTGHEARDVIELTLTIATKDQWNNWYRRILIKDLRCGISEKTVNKVLKEFKNIKPVPVFECMLAHDGANHESKITGKKLLEPKIDGVRVITIINMENRTVTQYSRNGKVFENFGHITRAIEENIDLIGRSMVLDGEIVSTSFQDLMRQVHRKENVQADDAVLMLFDILPLTEFQRGESVMGQRRRSALLRSFKTVFDKIGNIGVIPQKEVDLDSFVGDLEFKEYNKEMIDKGYEGIMIKDPEGNYVCKRSVSWLKQKPFIEVSLAVVDLEEGTGRNEGKLGALVCEGEDGGRQIKVNVGSGLSDKDRDTIWQDRVNIHGHVVEVRADAVTQNQDGTYSLRFPRFIKFRGFKIGEKI